MRKVIAVLFVLFLLESCKKAAKLECTPPRAEYAFLANKSIAILTDTVGGGSLFYRYQVTDGNYQIFMFDYHYEVCPGTLDLNPYRTIAFQVPAGVASFDLTDSSSLRQSKALVKAFCGECFGGARFLTNGFLSGRKLNESTWLIKGSLSSPLLPSSLYTFNATFRKK